MEKFSGHERMFLFPPALEDWVGLDHPARFIREFVDALDLPALGFKVRVSDEGRPSYANDVLLKVWIYGYMNRIRTSRRLEQACREHLSLIWLTGLLAPDHNTLWRFWKLHREQIRKLFRASVKMGSEFGLIGFTLHAIDGTKITSRSAKASGWHRPDLDKRLERLNAEIAELEAAIERGEIEEEGEYRMPERLADQTALRAVVQEKLKELDLAGEDHLHPNEPEARMVKNHGVVHFGYNGQAVVDDQSQMIVGNALVQDPFDQRQLVPMLDQMQQEWGRTADETVADGGYNTGEAILQTEEKEYVVTLAAGPADAESHPHDEYHSTRFQLDRERNVVVCPRGEELHFENRKKKNAKRTVDLYRCHSLTCPVRDLCSNTKKGRSIEIGPNYDAVQRQARKRRTPEGQARIRKRSTLAERPFAVIKVFLDYRRASAAGLENVRTEWSFICTIYNLRILFKHWIAARSLAAAA